MHLHKALYFVSFQLITVPLTFLSKLDQTKLLE